MKVLLLTAALLSPAYQGVGPIGLWDSATTSQGGIGTTLEFRADGTFVEATTVIVTFYYRVIGDRLVVAVQPLGADPSVSQSPSMTFEGDVLVMTDRDGSVVRKERMEVKGTGKPGLIGAWRYRHYTGATAFERYADDGRMFFRLPMRSAVGRYTVQSNELVMVRPNEPDVKIAFEIRGDVLRLNNGAGNADYRRDPAGPWYDAEHIAK